MVKQAAPPAAAGAAAADTAAADTATAEAAAADTATAEVATATTPQPAAEAQVVVVDLTSSEAGPSNTGTAGQHVSKKAKSVFECASALGGEGQPDQPGPSGRRRGPYLPWDDWDVDFCIEFYVNEQEKRNPRPSRSDTFSRLQLLKRYQALPRSTFLTWVSMYHKAQEIGVDLKVQRRGRHTILPPALYQLVCDMVKKHVQAGNKVRSCMRPFAEFECSKHKIRWLTHGVCFALCR